MKPATRRGTGGRRGPPGRVIGRLLVVLALVAVGAQSVSLVAQGRQEDAYGRPPTRMIPYREGVEPYRKFYLEPFVYRGPGRS